MTRNSLIALALGAVILTGCDQKDLCFDHWDHAKKLDFAVDVDWQLDWEYTYPGGRDWQATWDEALFGMSYDSLRPKRPEGLRAIVYNADDTRDESNVGPEGGKIFMTKGEHQLLFYNNDTEYIVFTDMTASAQDAKATTRAVSRSTFNAFDGPVNVPGADLTVNAPDPLFGHFVPEFNAVPSPEQQRLDFTMKPLVFSYLVRYHFKSGFEYVALARGALLGVAYQVYLTDGHTGPQSATVLYDCTLKDGYVEAVVRSFGAPDYPNPEYARANRPYGLNLEVRLKNGNMLNFDFDISEQMASQPRGGVIEVFDIEIPESEGESNGSGFDVTVDGWGDYIDIPIIFGNK